MGTNFTNQIRNSLPRGCYVLKHRASARLAHVSWGFHPQPTRELLQPLLTGYGSQGNCSATD